MAYTINLTDGTIFATVADGTINQDSSVTLVGKNYAGYGEFLDENFIQMLENYSSSSTGGNPDSSVLGNPLTGQIWWDLTNGVMKVYNGTVWKNIAAATASGTTPASSVVGDLWYDTVNAQLKVYDGAAYILVGPAFTAGTGTTGAIVDTITDNSLNSHVVIKFYVSNSVVGIVSKDAEFTPQVPISGFSNVLPGITLASTIAGIPQLFQGTALNAQLLDNLDSTDFLSSIANDTTSGTLGIVNDGGLTVGADSDGRLLVAGNDVFLRNQTQDGNLTIQINDGGVNTTVVQCFGANSMVAIPGAITVNSGGSITGSSIINGAANGVGNIGSASSYFNTIYATATTALYADVAERFESDVCYEPGTVVELGGEKEITQAMQDLSDRVFGVISTRPAFTMNGGAGDNDTHPPVAMTGRVPVKVIGTVRKGDRLVSAGNGVARAAQPGEATAFNVIGRALIDKINNEIGTVEAIVTIK
jgi:hypothetical protein